MPPPGIGIFPGHPFEKLPFDLIVFAQAWGLSLAKSEDADNKKQSVWFGMVVARSD